MMKGAIKGKLAAAMPKSVKNAAKRKAATHKMRKIEAPALSWGKKK